MAHRRLNMVIQDEINDLKNWAIQILLVDDNELIINCLETYIEEMETFSLISKAYDGAKAIEEIKKTTFEIIILDITMPKINGIDVIKFLKQHDDLKDIPVIIISGDLDNLYKKEAIALGITDFLNKPFMIDGVKNIINKVLKIS